MRVIKYLNVYKQTVNEEGDVIEELVVKNATIPTILNPRRITYYEPYYTDSGKLYKNVSIITYDNGEKFKVVGNYKNFNKSNKIGF